MNLGAKSGRGGDGRIARVPEPLGAGGPPTPWDRIWSYARYAEPARRRARARQKVDLLTAVGLRVGPQDTVVDLGCGSGEVTLELARRGARPERWLACDSSMAACSRAAAAFEREGLAVDVVCTDARQLPYRRGAASIVIACGVLEHVPEVDDAVSEIARILCGEGRLMLTTSHTNSIVYLERRIREAARLWPYGHQRNYRAGELRALLEPDFAVGAIETGQTAWDFPLAAACDRIIDPRTARPWGRYLAASCKRV